MKYTRNISFSATHIVHHCFPPRYSSEVIDRSFAHITQTLASKHNHCCNHLKEVKGVASFARKRPERGKAYYVVVCYTSLAGAQSCPKKACIISNGIYIKTSIEIAYLQRDKWNKNRCYQRCIVECTRPFTTAKILSPTENR